MSKIKEKYEAKDKQEKILIFIFLILLIAVLILSITTMIVKSNHKKQPEIINYVIPVLNKNNSFNFNVNIDKDNKSSTGEYYFKITNYREKEIIKEDIDYELVFSKNKNIKIDLYKNNKKIKVINNNDTITSNFLANEKQTDNYKMKISLINNEEKENNVIKIRVNS